MAQLTEKQKRFADIYVETGNATQAAIAAGYSSKTAKETGYENLTKPHIREYVDDLISKKDSARIAKQDEVLSFLTAILRGEVKESIPLGVGGGEQILVDNTPSMQVRKGAAELLGKRYGMWVDRQNIEGNMVVIKGDDGLED